MAFEFHWKNKEANFGLPAEKEVDGGTHFTIEIILKHGGKYVMVRRPKGYPGHQLPPKAERYPQGCLYFSHDLPRWGETLDQSVKRIVNNQLNVDVKNIHVTDLTMEKYPDELHKEENKQWAITVEVIAELAELPKVTGAVTEVVTFDINTIPEDMAWWEPDDLKETIKEHD